MVKHRNPDGSWYYLDEEAHRFLTEHRPGSCEKRVRAFWRKPACRIWLAICAGILLYQACPSTVTAAEIGGSNPQPRAITNGRVIPEASMPFMVRIESCTGTLIAPTWILTAAHCLFAENQVAPRNVTISHRGSDLQPLRFVLHEYRDIALIQLHRAPSDPATVSLATQAYWNRIKSGSQVTVAGYGGAECSSDLQAFCWGHVDGYTYRRQDELRAVKMTASRVGYGFLCLDDCMADHEPTVTGTRPGDSGGPTLRFDPLRNGYVQIGVHSRVNLDVAVGPLFDWIRAKVYEHSELPESQ